MDSQVKKLKQREYENRKLKHVVADLRLDNPSAEECTLKKPVAPEGIRASVSYVEVAYSWSQGYACRLLGLGRLTHRYRARKAERDTALRRRLTELAAKRMRFGYRRLTAMLVREGMPTNHKRVYRRYGEEGLAMRIRQRRSIRWSGGATSPAATMPNRRWSMDFVSDCVSTGNVIRMLTPVDNCTRECPVFEVDTSLGGLRKRASPGSDRQRARLTESDRCGQWGPEFPGRALAAWSELLRMRLDFIQSGKPVQNAYVGLFAARRICTDTSEMRA